MQGRLVPETEEETRRVHEMGINDVNKVLTLDEMCIRDRFGLVCCLRALAAQQL